MRDALYFLLSSHTVESANDPPEVFQVVKGSGMGLRHSGPLTDLVFYQRVERDKLDQRWYCADHGISHYFRFRDDIFITRSDKAQFSRLFNDMKRNADPISSWR